MAEAMPKARAPQPLLLTNIGRLVTLAPGGAGPRRGAAMRELGIIEDAAVVCAGGKIVDAGRRREVLRRMKASPRLRKPREVDCGGGVVLPGFVDAHTHPAFMAPRLADFEQRIAGATYEQIAEAGGGIRSSITGVREASRPALAGRVRAALDAMQAQGTTTVEAKSGYGLDLASELKSLEAIRVAAKSWPGTVVATLLGAHVVPPEFVNNRGEYVRLVCEEMIPQAAGKKLAQFVDVFTERTAFSAEETERIFAAAAARGLGLRAHVCQLSRTPLAPLLKHKPVSLDHLDCVEEDDIRALAKTNTIATLVPAANHFLGLDRYPPARALIDSGAVVALATDFNPGTAPTASMPFVLSLACTQMKMSPAEAISAATINGAHSLGLGERKGSIEPGKDADLAWFAVRDHREIAYWMAAELCAGTATSGVPAIRSR
jgi:imidazolonepropionase